MNILHEKKKPNRTGENAFEQGTRPNVVKWSILKGHYLEEYAKRII